MTGYYGNRLLVVLLGLWVVFAPALYAAPATAMSVQTNMSDDGGTRGCDGCPEGDMERGLCKVICLHAGQVAIAVELAMLTHNLGIQVDRERLNGMKGALPLPDPAPPKPISLL